MKDRNSIDANFEFPALFRSKSSTTLALVEMRRLCELYQRAQFVFILVQKHCDLSRQQQLTWAQLFFGAELSSLKGDRLN